MNVTWSVIFEKNPACPISKRHANASYRMIHIMWLIVNWIKKFPPHCHPMRSLFRVNIWYINVTCDDNFVFSFPRLLLLNKSKCTKSTVMYDPTYESRDITRSRNHVINHCRKLEMAYETPFIIFLNRAERNDSKWFMIFSTYRESILKLSKIQIDLIDGMILFTVFIISGTDEKFAR